MPIPVPTADSKGNADLGQCIRHLRKKNPEMDSDQRVAVCLSVFRKAHGQKQPKSKEK